MVKDTDVYVYLKPNSIKNKQNIPKIGCTNANYFIYLSYKQEKNRVIQNKVKKEVYTMSVLGLDIANRSIKAKSATGEACYINRLQPIYGMENELISVDKVIYEYEGQKYAITGKGLSSGGRNSKRYFTKEYLVELLIAVTKVTNEMSVDIVLPLPCEDYKNKGLLDEIRQHLLGKYKIKVNDVNRLIHVNSIRFISQPYGTLVDYLFDREGKLIESRAKYKYVICDIGSGTTDIICTDGVRLEKVIGCNIGCMDIMNRYLDNINSTRTDIKITRDDITGNFKSHIEKYEEIYDFTDELNRAKLSVVNEIKTFINDSGIDMMLYDRILYCGGGSILLEKDLITQKNEKLYPNAQKSNARGAYLYGVIRNG